MIEVKDMPISEAFKIAEAKTIVDNYDKVVAFFEGEFHEGFLGMTGKQFADTHYLYDDNQKRKLEEAKAILEINHNENM